MFAGEYGAFIRKQGCSKATHIEKGSKTQSSVAVDEFKESWHGV